MTPRNGDMAVIIEPASAAFGYVVSVLSDPYVACIFLTQTGGITRSVLVNEVDHPEFASSRGWKNAVQTCYLVRIPPSDEADQLFRERETEVV